MRSFRVGRRALREIATIMTPDTLLRWHRQFIASKWTYATPRASRRGVLSEIRRLVVQMFFSAEPACSANRPREPHVGRELERTRSLQEDRTAHVVI